MVGGRDGGAGVVGAAVGALGDLRPARRVRALVPGPHRDVVVLRALGGALVGGAARAGAVVGRPRALIRGDHTVREREERDEEREDGDPGHGEGQRRLAALALAIGDKKHTPFFHISYAPSQVFGLEQKKANN